MLFHSDRFDWTCHCQCQPLSTASLLPPATYGTPLALGLMSRGIQSVILWTNSGNNACTFVSNLVWLLIDLFDFRFVRHHLSTTRWGHYFCIFGLQVIGIPALCSWSYTLINTFGLQVIEAFPRLVCRVPSRFTSQRRGNVYDYPAQAANFSTNLGGGLTFPFWEDPTLDPLRITEGSVLVLDPTQPLPIQAIQRSKRPVVAYVRYSSGNITPAEVHRMQTAADTCIATIQAHRHWELVAAIAISACHSVTGLHPFITCSMGSLYVLLVDYSNYA